MVNKAPARRRLSVEDRRLELVRVVVELIATRHWDVVTMADIAARAQVSKPLLYHYFSTKTALYHAAVRTAAEDLQAATEPDPDLPPPERLRQALRVHVDWVETNAHAYRAILQGGLSADPAVQAIVERSRTEVVTRIAQGMGIEHPRPRMRIAVRGWVGFLEAACLDWLAAKDISKEDLVGLLAASLPGAIRSAGAQARQAPSEDDGARDSKAPGGLVP